MKKEELRIGNWYQSVKWNVPVKCDLTDLYNLSANADGADDDPPIDEMFEPIILTEEWLLKFGFIDYRTLPNKITKKAFYDIKAGIYLSYDGKYKHTKFRILYNPNTNTFQVVSPANNSIILKYVHQLQNLYFALTNNELTI